MAANQAVFLVPVSRGEKLPFMARTPTASVDQRLKRIPVILDLLRKVPHPAEDLLPRVNQVLAKTRIPEISIRTLQHDLEWMQQHLGEETIERVPGSALDPAPGPEFKGRRWFWRLAGAEDLIPVSTELAFISELEAVALRTAQALLTGPPNPDGHLPEDPGPLAMALARLTGRLGLSTKDTRIPDIIGVNRSTPEPYDPQVLVTLLRAIRLRESITMTYASLGKAPHEVIAQPIRLVLNDGEPYLWAWDGTAGKLKNYKIARMTEVIRRKSIKGVPAGLDTEVRGEIASSFRGVAGRQQRARVVLRVAPAGIPHLRGRRLGASQHWEDLPGGEVRVSFNTAGLEAVKHWLLQFGDLAVAESPAGLVTWMRDQAESMAKRYRTPQG
jgi:predicted DNA-binding transcriptional regulator YafY